MPSNQAFDSQEFEQLYLPYAPNVSKLANEPLLVDGSNLLTTWGGTLKKRFPVTAIGPSASLGFRCDRLWIYETLEPTPNVYVVGSFYDPTDLTLPVWVLYYFNLSTVSPVWIKVTEKRACNHSTLPHEGISRRGILYIKSFPMNAGVTEGVDYDVLGSIALNGDGGSINTHVWGTLGPTDPAALSDPGTWSASTNPISVLQGWAYTYTWVEQSGNESPRAALETNPDKSPSSVGAFANLIPSMTVVGPDDTSEFPFINIYRTTDGGGTFFFVYQMVNVGGSQTFTDSHSESGSGGGVFNDPLPDQDLDTSHVSPTTTSNGPPPTTTPPGTTGSDPILQCTRIVEYAGRLWFGINEYLFYSALEELDEGVPEECFPAGDVLPNFFRMPKGISSLDVTPSGLLVNTRTETIRVEGTNRSAFNPRPFLGGVGGAAQQFRAATEAGEYAAWCTQDFRLTVVHNDSFAILSNSIGSVIEAFADAGSQIDLKFWAHGDKEWIVVAAHNQADTTLSRWVIYDMNLSLKTQKDYWNVPWKIRSTALAVGQQNVTDTENKLLVALWDGTHMRLAKMNINTTDFEDLDPAGTSSAFGYSLTTSLMMVPPGDHVNELRRPDFSPVIASVGLTRKDVTGDADPDVSVYIDDLFNNAIALGQGESPARRTQSDGYVDLTYNDVNQVAKHVSMVVEGAEDAFDAELYALQLSWTPNSGA